ncbi:hypothetical protein VNO77_42146 [Canavalia gladiata]|uniref:Uncharacterized protein n=1 Tax=Canavalia gladiata TaxID=3824 RepID=A0AAN9K1T8_CANGL
MNGTCIHNFLKREDRRGKRGRLGGFTVELEGDDVVYEEEVDEEASEVRQKREIWAARGGWKEAWGGHGGCGMGDERGKVLLYSKDERVAGRRLGLEMELE